MTECPCCGWDLYGPVGGTEDDAEIRAVFQAWVRSVSAWTDQPMLRPAKSCADRLALEAEHDITHGEAQR